MAKKKSPNSANSAIAAGSEDLPQTKTAAAKRFLVENPDLVATHTYKELAGLISQKYNFSPTAGDVANAKSLISKTRPKAALKRRSSAVATSSEALAFTVLTAVPTPSKKPAAAATDAVNATLNLVRAVGLEQAAAIISGLTKAN